MTQATDTVAAYVDAAVGGADLQEDLQAVWDELRSEPEVVAEVAALLKIDSASLQGLDRVPVRIKPSRSGIAAGEIVVLVATWVATDIVLKALADLGKDAVKSALQKLWDKHMEKRLAARQKMPRALGSRDRKA